MGVVVLMWAGTLAYAMAESGYYLIQHQKLSTLGALLGKAPVAAGSDVAEQAAAKSSESGIGAGIVAYAVKALGLPYRYGAPASCAGTPTSYDCSGLTQCAVLSATSGKVNLPHNTVAQVAYFKAKGWTVKAPWTIATLLPGDLIYYWIAGEAEPGHCAIYIGAGKVIDAPHTGVNVRQDVFNLSTILAVARIPAATPAAKKTPAKAAA